MNTIDRLTQRLEPVRRLPSLGVLLPVLSGLIITASVLLLAFSIRLRSDLGTLVDNPFFLASSLLWLACFGTALRLALLSAIPGSTPRHPGRWIALLLTALATTFALAPGSGFVAGLAMSSGLPCAISLVVLSILPASAVLVFARLRLAPTNPRRTVRLIVAAGVSVAGFALALHCGSESSGHLLGYHLAPALLLIAFAPLALVRALLW